MPATKTTGVVYDLDYLQNQNWCQVLIRDGFVGYVREYSLLLPLDAAITTGYEATVYHDDGRPARIDRVFVERKTPSDPAGSGLYYVTKLDADETEGKFKATLVGDDTVSVFTRDARMASLLATAFASGWRMGYVSYDPMSKELTRGKLNAEDQKAK